jgi:hypothetical protein
VDAVRHPQEGTCFHDESTSFSDLLLEREIQIVITLSDHGQMRNLVTRIIGSFMISSLITMELALIHMSFDASAHGTSPDLPLPRACGTTD